jgi:hypothetical protein
MRFIRFESHDKYIKKYSIDIENLFNKEINNELNIYSSEQSKYNNKLINELFIGFFRPYMSLYLRISDCNEYEVVGKISDKDKILLYAVNKKLGFREEEQNNPLYYFTHNLRYLTLSVINILLISIGLFLFAFINSLLTEKSSFNKKIIIERTKAASSKLKWHKENLGASIIKEKIKLKNEFYSSIRIRDLPTLFCFLIVNVFKDYIFLIRYSKILMGQGVVPFLHYYYSKRVPHAVLYEFALACTLKKHDIDECYSGNNLDRYGIIEEKLCKKYNVKLVNIPHGIEYGFLLPHCFTGDIFYSYSDEGAKYLNKQYNTNKFIFAEEVIRNVLKRNYEKSESYIVFFTEALGIEINRTIIKEAKKISSIKGFEFYIKLHPIDKKENYTDLGTDFINDFDSAITNNICIARKSTVLLEAVYNNSKAIAVMLNESDKFGFEQFPSLRDERISRVYELSQLESFI